MPSGDAFQWSSWEAGSSLTLTPNPSYWGPAPESSEIVVRYITQDAQAQALANGEIQAMDPQPNQELLAQLDGIDGIQVFTGDQFTFEHYDFNFGVDALTNFDVRQAFALCLPRQEIVDRLIKPQNPNATVLNNRYFESFEADYAGQLRWPLRHRRPRQGQTLLEGSGVSLPLTIRLGYRTPNPRRTDEVALVAESCNQVGFDIQDAGSDTFFDDELAERQLRHRAVRVGRQRPEDGHVLDVHDRWRQQPAGLLQPRRRRAGHPAQLDARSRRRRRPGQPDRHHPVAGPGDDPGVHVPGGRGSCRRRHERGVQPDAGRVDVERGPMASRLS